MLLEKWFETGWFALSGLLFRALDRICSERCFVLLFRIYLLFVVD